MIEIFFLIFMCILAPIGLLHVWFLSYLLITFLKSRLVAKKRGYQNEVLFWNMVMLLFILAPVFSALFFSHLEYQMHVFYSICLSAAMFYACVLARVWWNQRVRLNRDGEGNFSISN